MTCTALPPPRIQIRITGVGSLRCKPDVIVTFNLKDFPESELSKYDVEPQHPDEFILNMFDLDSVAVAEAVKRQRASLKIHPLRLSNS